MYQIDNDTIINILFDISKKFILPMYKNLKENDVMKKNNTDLVTSVDIKVEKELEKILCNLIPNSVFVGEELYSANPKILQNYKLKKYCWTVDPIDGTTNFVKGKEKFAIMIALSYNKKILQSWIYKPLTEDFCSSKNGEGAFINGNRIEKSNYTSINKSKGSISLKYWDQNYYSKMNHIKDIFSKTNSYGCIGFEYIDICLGLRNFAILSKLSPWDHLPGILMLRESGGFDSYFDNGTYNHCIEKKNLVIANNTQLGNEILSLLKE